MKRRTHYIFAFLLFSALSVQAAATFGDLAVSLAKGYFKNYVTEDASLEECAAFLNDKGVCFSLFDLMDPDLVVKQEDFARVLGQSTLLFSGEAHIVNGCIERPEIAKTWVDYCLLNDVHLTFLWKRFLQRTEKGSFPEVDAFFGKSLTEEKK
jgi:hypothetical protein